MCIIINIEAKHTEGKKMKARKTDIEIYSKEYNGELPAGSLYNSLYKESRENGAHQNAAKAIASRRWNLANKAYWAAA